MKPSSWMRSVVLAVSCLVLGLVGGWSLANLGGDELSLPEANVDVTVQQPAPSTTTVTADEETAPERDQVGVSVLNGTGREGFAATTATRLKELGYTKVSTGNTPTQTGPTVVYFRDGARAAADRLATDLQATTVTALEGTAFEQGADATTQLVVVLGNP